MVASVLENSSSNGRIWHSNLGGNAVSPHVMFIETKMTLPYVSGHLSIYGNGCSIFGQHDKFSYLLDSLTMLVVVSSLFLGLLSGLHFSPNYLPSCCHVSILKCKV